MTIKEVLGKYKKIEIELLLAHVLGQSKEFLYVHSAYQLSANQQIKLQKLVKRRLKGEPVAYLVGYKDFYGLRFKVTKDTLIPRPETEELVELVKNQILKIKNKNLKPIRILDIGTGSGCIIVSLAKGLSAKGQEQRSTFFASDVSLKALKVAKENAKIHKVKVEFIQSDLLSKVKANLRFNIIVANLPYGWGEWRNNSSQNTIGLKFEPKQALFTKEKGIYLIRRLLYQVSLLKQKPNVVYLEFDPRQKQFLSKIIKKILPKSKQEFFKDISGKWRIVEISLN